MFSTPSTNTPATTPKSSRRSVLVQAAGGAAIGASLPARSVVAQTIVLSAIYKEMKPLVDAINAASVTSIEGFRAEALVAFWEVAPLGAGNSEFSFEDPFQ